MTRVPLLHSYLLILIYSDQYITAEVKMFQACEGQTLRCFDNNFDRFISSFLKNKCSRENRNVKNIRGKTEMSGSHTHTHTHTHTQCCAVYFTQSVWGRFMTPHEYSWQTVYSSILLRTLRIHGNSHEVGPADEHWAPSSSFIYHFIYPPFLISCCHSAASLIRSIKHSFSSVKLLFFLSRASDLIFCIYTEIYVQQQTNIWKGHDDPQASIIKSFVLHSGVSLMLNGGWGGEKESNVLNPQSL